MKIPQIFIPRIKLQEHFRVTAPTVFSGLNKAEAIFLHMRNQSIEPHFSHLCLSRACGFLPPGFQTVSNTVTPSSSSLGLRRRKKKEYCAPAPSAPAAGVDVESGRSVARRVLDNQAQISSTEAQGAIEPAGGGGSTAPPAAAPPTSQLTLLVMQPCSAREEADAGAGAGAIRRPVASVATAPSPALGGCSSKNLMPGYEVAGNAEDEPAEIEVELLDASDPPGGGESTASPEELEDEETHSGGESGRASAGVAGGSYGGGSVSKTCTIEGCSETTSQVAKQRKPWMCKKHRNKMYKDKYKKKKSDQALSLAGSVKLEESTDGSASIGKQRTGSIGDRPARPTLLEQVLNQKRLALLRSPEVVQFLQRQQQLLNQQVLEQRQQQQFPGASV
uniref:Regulatory factor X associated protein n=1 Tax=Monodelphis domestica TaxID=13616 RepID=A0A5F8GV81_MONDO